MSIWWEEDKLTNYVHKSMRTAEGRVPKKKGKVWSFTKPNPGKKKASIKEQKKLNFGLEPSVKFISPIVVFFGGNLGKISYGGRGGAG